MLKTYLNRSMARRALLVNCGLTFYLVRPHDEHSDPTT